MLPITEHNDPIDRLYEHECTAVIAVTRQRAGKTVDGVAFIFLRVADVWYGLSFVDRTLSCKIGDPFGLIFSVDNDWSYKHTDLSPLMLTDTARVTDVYLTEGPYFTKCVICFTHSRSIELRCYWNSGHTMLSIL